MVRSELLQKMCNLHPDILARDMEKIFEIIFIEFTNAFCRNENIIGSSHPWKAKIIASLGSTKAIRRKNLMK